MAYKPRVGECYNNCWMALMDIHEERPEVKTYLVHGYPHLTKADGDYPAGTMFGHAWLEEEFTPTPGVVITFCRCVLTNARVLKETFYRVGRIDEALVTRYTKKEAVDLAIRFGHCGEWAAGPPGAVFKNRGPNQGCPTESQG